MDGKLSIRSEPGLGSTVTIVLPKRLRRNEESIDARTIFQAQAA
jgi:hypothetical protein